MAKQSITCTEVTDVTKICTGKKTNFENSLTKQITDKVKVNIATITKAVKRNTLPKQT